MEGLQRVRHRGEPTSHRKGPGMTRKSVFLGVAILLPLLALCGGVLAFLVLREPDDYVNKTLPPGPERTQFSQEFQAKCSSLIDGIVNDREWEERFTEEQINSYFEEDFIRSG